MTVLSIHPESSALVHAAAATLLTLHIGAGSVGLLSGAAAFVFRNGTDLHRLVGKIFVVSMLIMSAIGATVAPFLPTPERASVVAGGLTFYLVLSSWTAVKRQPGRIGAFDYALLLTSLSVIAAGGYFFWLASHNPRGMLDGQPGAAFVMFMILGSLAAVGDLRLILNRGVTGATRLARHLWRMTVALFIAANSLFLGQQQIFPQGVQQSGLLNVPALLMLILLVYWLGHVAWGGAQAQAGWLAAGGVRQVIDMELEICAGRAGTSAELLGRDNAWVPGSGRKGRMARHKGWRQIRLGCTDRSRQRPRRQPVLEARVAGRGRPLAMGITGVIALPDAPDASAIRGIFLQCRRKKGLRAEAGKPFFGAAVFVVGRAGFEPATNGLKVRCSTS